MRIIIRNMLLVFWLPAALCTANTSSVNVQPDTGKSSSSWDTFNGNLQAQKFSDLSQITPSNVKHLTEAWRMHTGDYSNGSRVIDGKVVPASAWSATPIFANNTVYIGTPFYRIFALEPDTGKTKWIFNPKAELEALTQPEMKSRGVAYWQATQPTPGETCQKRVYIGTMDAKLFSVDADTGDKCTDFGTNGVLDINQWNERKNEWPLSLLQPPTVYKDILLLGWAGKDWHSAVAPLGTVFALDARTGKRLWTFYSIPKLDDKYTGTANVWASMSVDTEKEIVYLPVSSPSPNFYGGNRLQPIPLATSITALNINTGKVIWSRQLIHHDLWDYDTNSAPTLVDIKKDGKVIPALVQTSKQGFLYILNRYTGEPVYPIIEKPVPASMAMGEVASKTQPFVETPEPTNNAFPGIFPLADITGLGYCTKTYHNLRYDGRFTPPSTQGSMVYPGTVGGVEWGGGAVDSQRQIFVANNSNVVQIYKLIPRSAYQKLVESGKTNEASGGYFPMLGNNIPYGFQLTAFLNPIGMPCWKPPYGELSAYDLTTGNVLWRKPFGQIQHWGFYMPESWGSITIGAPAMTASGLIFIGASMDSRVRAIDVKSGDVLWKGQAAAPVVSNPSIYSYKGKQYVVFVAGGNAILTPQVSDQVIAFALPDSDLPQSQ